VSLLSILMHLMRLDCQWVETNTSNIHIFPTDICVIADWWYYANGFYRC